LDVVDTKGAPLHIVCSGSATYDEKGACIGVDFTLRPAAGPSGQLLHLSTPTAIFDTEDKSYLELYFSAQVDALRVLLVRLGGARLGSKLEMIVNETAQRNGWAVSMEDSQVVIDLLGLKPDVYRALLTKAVTYAVGVIGERLVKKQMQAVDEQMGERAIDLARELGLRELFATL
jgi:hypothetical protein